MGLALVALAAPVAAVAGPAPTTAQAQVPPAPSPPSAGPPPGAAPALEVVVSADGGDSWHDEAEVGPGEPAVVRIWFVHQGPHAIDHAQVRATLPPGFRPEPDQTRVCASPGTRDPLAPVRAGRRCSSDGADAVADAAVWQGERLEVRPSVGPAPDAAASSSPGLDDAGDADRWGRLLPGTGFVELVAIAPRTAGRADASPALAASLTGAGLGHPGRGEAVLRVDGASVTAAGGLRLPSVPPETLALALLGCLWLGACSVRRAAH